MRIGTSKIRKTEFSFCSMGLFWVYLGLRLIWCLVWLKRLLIDVILMPLTAILFWSFARQAILSMLF
ncbi:hypothetical protein [Candidatus Liberibacter sp.]|uniref:hypothetical protein n=1 Tax=Candidatus Liberibacter sp. TaxID=34022 RepID=UPI0015F42705|nr:hypothetical protein [Candidatus Liberibacter sp.]MBA5724060.1 hypothetical protein [Candidatus Liberibacter sp.]